MSDPVAFDPSQPFDVVAPDQGAPVAAAAAPAPAQSAAPTFDPSQPFEVAHPQAGPSGSGWVDWGRRLATAGTDALGGTLALPHLAAQGADWLAGKAGVNLGATKAIESVPDPSDSSRPLFPDAQTAREMAYNTTGATEYVPQTTAGRWVQGGLNAVPYALTNPASIPAAFAGGTTGEAAAELAPNHPYLARALGFLFGAHSADAALNGTGRLAATAAGATPSETFQAYERQGVPTIFSGDVTGNPTLQMLQSQAKNIPGSADVMKEGAHKVVGAWQDAVNKSASMLGPSATLQDAGTSLQNAAQNWLQGFKGQSQNLWNNFRMKVPATTPVPVTNFRSALDDTLQTWGGADNLASELQPQQAAKLKAALEADAGTSGALPWQAVQATRSRLGEMLESGQPLATDMAQSSIKRLYGALSDDMRSAANSAGPDAAKAFNAANAYTAFGHSLLEDHLNPILTADNPEMAAKYALGQVKNGASRLNAIDFAMPGQAQNLGATVLRAAAKPDTDMLGNPIPGTGSPRAFATAVSNLSPEARQALFGPELSNVGDQVNIGRSMRDSAAYANPSGSGHTVNSGPIARFLMAKEAAELAHKATGSPVAGGAAFAAGLAGPRVFGTGARYLAMNPALSRIFSTEPPVTFTPPGLLPRAAIVATQPDLRTLPGAPARTPFLSGP